MLKHETDGKPVRFVRVATKRHREGSGRIHPNPVLIVFSFSLVLACVPLAWCQREGTGVLPEHRGHSASPVGRKGIRFCPLRFSKPKIVDLKGGIARMAVADLGNGHPDIVLTDYTGGPGTNGVDIFYGKGGGRIGRMHYYPLHGGPDALAVADLGNGHPDIVVTRSNRRAVTILYGVGGGRIGPIRSYGVGNYPGNLAVADLGNGHPDIVVVNDHTVSVLYGMGGGRIGPIRSYPVGRQPYGLAVADLGNGHPDIVVANDHTVSVLYGAGGGRIGPIRSYPAGRHLFWLAVADLGNGHPDIVVDSGRKVVVFYGVGGGRFGPVRSYWVGKRQTDLLVSDLGNGHPDIVITSHHKVFVFYGVGGGRFAPPVSYSSSGGRWISSIEVADLGNGHPGIVVSLSDPKTKEGRVEVLYGIGDGRFAPPVLYPAGGEAEGEGLYPMAVADLGNGHPDIIGVHRFAGTMVVLYGEGKEPGCGAPSMSMMRKGPVPAGSMGHEKAGRR